VRNAVAISGRSNLAADRATVIAPGYGIEILTLWVLMVRSAGQRPHLEPWLDARHPTLDSLLITGKIQAAHQPVRADKPLADLAVRIAKNNEITSGAHVRVHWGAPLW
jgi:hypothetical protein